MLSIKLIFISLLFFKCLSLASLLSPKSIKTLQTGISIELSNIIEQTALSAYNFRIPHATPFLYPADIQLIRKTYAELDDFKLQVCGGFNQFDKCRLVFSRYEEYEKDLIKDNQDTASNTQENISLHDKPDDFLLGVRVKGSHQLECFGHSEMISCLRNDLLIDSGTVYIYFAFFYSASYNNLAYNV